MRHDGNCCTRSPIDTIRDILIRRENIVDVDGDLKVINELATDVRNLLRTHQDSLPVDFILESLTSLGQAPSLIYDDNAHWTVGGDGSQNLIMDEDRDKETVFDGYWIVPPNAWKKTIREAIRDYLEEE